MEVGQTMADHGVVGGVDTHKDLHVAAVVDALDRVLESRCFATIRRGPWRSFEAVEFATLEWVDWFNNRRLLEPIGNLP
jgi:putative transposase